MKITAIELTNVRSFKRLNRTYFSQAINVFIGANNVGKSTILQCLLHLQNNGSRFRNQDITLGEQSGSFDIFVNGEPRLNSFRGVTQIVYSLHDGNFSVFNDTGNYKGWNDRPASTEPNNFIYPYTSKRKVRDYSEQINDSMANSVTGDLQNLFAKIDRICTPQLQPANSEYVESCREILGFEISTLAKGNGKRAVYFVKNLDHIEITSMGEGVANILGLLVDLCIAENKVFIIEELENDIHPKALRALLRLIIKKSSVNQFFISTHSNIVMQCLGAVEYAKVFEVSSYFSDDTYERLLLSNVRELVSPELRFQALVDLGYDFEDLFLYQGWLFFEESSAERIVREYLIKWFAPGLIGRVRTFSSGGKDKLASRFDNFNSLFVFVHLQSSYKNRAWVIIDGGADENRILEDLKGKYIPHGWSSENFIQLSKHDFEYYYPKRFLSSLQSILSLPKTDRQGKKKELLTAVVQWISSDEAQAMIEFEDSAQEFISILRRIEGKVTPQYQ